MNDYTKPRLSLLAHRLLCDAAACRRSSDLHTRTAVRCRWANRQLYRQAVRELQAAGLVTTVGFSDTFTAAGQALIERAYSAAMQAKGGAE